MLELTPSEVKKFITNALKIRKIPYVAGVAGIGKSDIFEQVADDFNLKLLDIRLSQKLPEDLTGLPIRNEKTNKAEYIPFDTFPMENDPIPEGYVGWLVFLDELSSASDEVWAAVYSLLLGHTVGGRKLHSKALIAAAGNRASDSAIARALPDTLITRILPCNMKVSSKDWLAWAEDPRYSVNRATIEFIIKNPDMLLNTIHHAKREELESYGNPRGWETVSKLANLHEKQTGTKGVTQNLDSKALKLQRIPEDMSHSMSAAVGAIEAKAFIEFYDEQMTIPYPWEVAQSASSIPIPTSAMGRMELTEELAKHFIETGAQSREALLLYMNRNEPEIRELFCSLIKDLLGETASDFTLMVDIRKRLSTHEPTPGTVQPDGSSVIPDPNKSQFKITGVTNLIPPGSGNIMP